MLNLLLAALLCLWARPQRAQGHEGSAQLVGTPQDFICALARADALQLTGDIVLGQDHGCGPLPVVVPPGKCLTVASAGGTSERRAVLDLRAAPQLLHLGPGSQLVLRGLSIRVASAAQLLASAPDAEVRGSPLFPAVVGGDRHQVVFEWVDLLLQQPRCSLELQAATAAALQALAGPGGEVSLSFDSTTITVAGAYSVALPITAPFTGAQLGVAEYSYSNYTVTCLPEGRPRSGTCPLLVKLGWADTLGPTLRMWALAGALACLAMAAAQAAAAAAPAWRQRHQRRWVLSGMAAGESPFKLMQQQLERQPQQPGAQQGLAPLAAAAVLRALSLPPAGCQREPSACRLEKLSLPASLLSEGLSASLSLLMARDGSFALSEDEQCMQTVWRSRVGHIEGLEIGPLLGHGSFGSVHMGRWNGALVAVKTIETRVQGGRLRSVSREPLLSAAVSHPCVVTTYKQWTSCLWRAAPGRAEGSSSSTLCSLPVGSNDGACCSGGGGSVCWSNAWASCSEGPQGAGAGACVCGAASSPAGSRGRCSCNGDSGSGDAAPLAGTGEALPSQHEDLPPGLYESVIVQEFCDRGNLSDAIMAGKFRDPATQQLELVPVLLCLIDVATGMEHLHALDIVHADLKASNILLKTSRNDRRNFVCKVADFGLSRMLGQHQTHVNTGSIGTANHAAPELMTQGRLTKASDVYAFGIIIWEVMAGAEAFEDLSAIQIIARVSQSPDFRPPLPPGSPSPLTALMERCWAAKPQERPAFTEVVAELRALLLECRQMEDARLHASCCSQQPQPRLPPWPRTSPGSAGGAT